MEKLRGKGGCPWDQEQTHSSIAPYTVEEAHEVEEAVDKGDDNELKKELGDLLLQVVFHSQIARERGAFSIDDVLKALSDKLQSRHPHVFGDTKVKDSQDVLNNWERFKHKEGRHSILDGIPKKLPALMHAWRVQSKASHVGFDWDKKEDVVKKVREEFEELNNLSDDHPQTAEELGDILFSIVNMSRFLNVEPERALKNAIKKFTERFTFIEEELIKKGRDIKETTLKEMDKLWEKAKLKK